MAATASNGRATTACRQSSARAGRAAPQAMPAARGLSRSRPRPLAGRAEEGLLVIAENGMRPSSEAAPRPRLKSGSRRCSRRGRAVRQRDPFPPAPGQGRRCCNECPRRPRSSSQLFSLIGNHRIPGRLPVGARLGIQTVGSVAQAKIRMHPSISRIPSGAPAALGWYHSDVPGSPAASSRRMCDMVAKHDLEILPGVPQKVPHSAGTAAPATATPAGATDTHHHIYDDRFPAARGGPARRSRPSPTISSSASVLAFHGPLSLRRYCLATTIAACMPTR